MSMVTEYKEEKKKISPLAQWIKDEAITGFKTKDEIEAEKAMAETSKADYYKSLNAVKAVNDGERQGILDSYDNFFTNNYTTIANLSQGRFLGYAFLSYLAQDAFIRRAVTTRADEMTRAWGELTGEDKEKSTEEKINFVTSELERVETKNIFRKASNLTGYFGGCLAYIDMRANPNEPLSDEELATPLYKVGQDDFNKAKLKGLKLVGLQPIEPINIAPSTYNSSDPTAKNFYEPEYFYILGRKIHKSRFLYFAENIPPQILKPVYLFFGIPLAQIMFPYVQAFYKSKDVVNNVVLKFSCTSISTDIDGLIAVDGENAVLNRINTIAKYRDNNSVIVLDKNTEDMQQINTPITGLREILYANLELLPVISGIPTTKFLETSPTGLNATGEYDMRNFYDLINTLQNNTFNEPINKLIDIICYSNGLDSNGLTWTWKPLYQMSDREKAEVNQMKANTSNIYVQMGAITNADVARQLMNDKDSEYESLEIPEPIDINEQEEEVDMRENGEDTEIDKILKDGVEDEDFKESDHPRDKSGKFTSGSNSTQSPKEEGSEKKSKPIEITGKEIGNYKDIKELQSKAIEYYKTHLQGKTVENKDLGEVFFSRVGMNKFISSGADPNKLKMVVVLPDIIKYGKYEGAEKPKHDKNGTILKYHRVSNTVKMDGKNYKVSALIWEDRQGNKFYNLNPNADEYIKEEASVGDTFVQRRAADTSNNIITEKEHFVKPQNKDFINLFVEEITDEKPSLWKRLKGLFDADRWITIHPPHGNKEDTGIPLKIGEDGEIKAGAGGKFTGKKINTIKKQRDDTSTPSGGEEKNSKDDIKSLQEVETAEEEAMAKYNKTLTKYLVEQTKDLKAEVERLSENVNALTKKKYEMKKNLITNRAKAISQKLKNYQQKTESVVKSFSSVDDSFIREIDKKRKSYLDAQSADTMTRFKLFSEYAALKNSSKDKLKEMATNISNSLKKGFKSNFRVSAYKVTPKAKNAFNTARGLLDGFFSDDISKGHTGLTVTARSKARAYFSHNRQEIIMASDDDFDVVIHEYGHFLEANNPNMLLNSKAFLEYRTKNEEEQSLNKLTKGKGYGKEERAKADKFFSPYCGKFYDDATEIMSMGLQRLFTDAKKFAEEDREYFDFVIANARGEL